MNQETKLGILACLKLLTGEKSTLVEINLLMEDISF